MVSTPSWSCLGRAGRRAFAPRLWGASAPFVWLAWFALLGRVGWAPALLLGCLGALAPCRISYEELRGNSFFGVLSAWRFAATRAPRLLLVVALPGVALALVWFAGEALGALCSPGGAPAWLAVSLWLTGALALFLAWFCFVAWVWGPALTACTNEEALEVLAQLTRLAIRAPLMISSLRLALFLVFLLFGAGALWFLTLGLWARPALDLWSPLSIAPATQLRGGALIWLGPLLLTYLHAWLANATTRLVLDLRQRLDGEDLLARQDRADAGVGPEAARWVPHAAHSLESERQNP